MGGYLLSFKMHLNVGFLTFDMPLNVFFKSGYLNVACRVLKCSRMSLEEREKIYILGEAHPNYLG